MTVQDFSEIQVNQMYGEKLAYHGHEFCDKNSEFQIFGPGKLSRVQF